MNSTLKPLDYILMAAYLVAMVIIGILSVRKEKNKDSKAYLLGGGNMHYFALGISCLMAALSAFSIVMVPGEIYNHGLSMMLLGVFTPFLVILGCKLFFPFFYKLGSFTPYAYLEKRYNPAVRSMIALLGLYSSMTYLGMVLFSTSKIFAGAAGWPAWFTILFIGLISLAFTTAGGLKAVVWTDVMQFVVLIGGLFCILFFLFWKIDGGLFAAISISFKEGHGFTEYANKDFYSMTPYNRLSFWVMFLSMIVGAIQTNLTSQQDIQRMLASGSPKNAIKTQFVNAIFSLPTTLILWVIGMGTYVYYRQHTAVVPESGDTALFTFISNEIPTPLPGLILAGMMAAVISTLNAVFNSLATIYVKEFHVRYFNPQISEEKQVRLSRIATVIVGVLAICQGLVVTFSSGWLKQSVAEASTIFSIFSSIVLPAFLYAIFSKRASTMLVWVGCGLVWGVKVGTTLWFILSTRDFNDWKPGMPFGYAGGISFLWPTIITVGGLVLTYLWNHKRNPNKAWHTFLMMIPTLIVGTGIGLLLWAICSNAMITDTPKAVSFQWIGWPSDVMAVLVGVIWLNVGKIQPKEKWEGMVLSK